MYAGNKETKSTKYRREIWQKLDAILEHEDWEVDDIIEYKPDHDNILSPTLDCIIYYTTGFHFNILTFLGTASPLINLLSIFKFTNIAYCTVSAIHR